MREIQMCTECHTSPSTCQCGDSMDCADPHMCAECRLEAKEVYEQEEADQAGRCFHPHRKPGHKKWEVLP